VHFCHPVVKNQGSGISTTQTDRRTLCIASRCKKSNYRVDDISNDGNIMLFCMSFDTWLDHHSKSSVLKMNLTHATNASVLTRCRHCDYSASQKNPPCGPAVFWHFFHRRWRIFNQFLRTYYTFLSTLDYKFLFQLSPTWTKLRHIKRDCLVHTICSKYVQTFAKVADSFVDRCLWQVVQDLLLLKCQQTCWIWHDVNSDVSLSVSKLRS